MEIIWKDIVGYEGLYQVSNMGNIRSLNYNHTKNIKELKIGISTAGYGHVSLFKDGKKYTEPVAKCVWIAFNGPIPKGMQINHINEDKTDNRLVNLNLMTPKDNINWGTHNLRMSKTKTNGSNSKAIIQKNLEGQFLKRWPSLNEIGRAGYNMGNVWLCCHGKRNIVSDCKWEYEKREVNLS